MAQPIQISTSNSLKKPRTIGKLAKEAGVNIETIRFYERRGLLRQPKPSSSRWRTYDDSAVWVLHYIKLGRELGFTLAEIKKVMRHIGRGKQFCASFQNALQEKIGLVRARIEELHNIQVQLKKAHADCLVRSGTGYCPIADRCSAAFSLPLAQTIKRKFKGDQS